MEKKFAIGSDHAGFVLKELLKTKIAALGISLEDYGTFSAGSVDYPDFAIPLCEDLEEGKFSLGILICGSGNGMIMTANKFPGIRAALCWEPEIARLARLHNDANILALPARFVSEEMALQILDVFMATDFEGGRHIRRVEKMMKACREN